MQREERPGIVVSSLIVLIHKSRVRREELIPWYENQEYALWQHRSAGESNFTGSRCRSHIRRPWLQCRTETLDGSDQARHPAQGLLVLGCLQPVRYLQPRQYVPMVPSSGEETRRRLGVRSRGLDGRNGKVPSLG